MYLQKLRVALMCFRRNSAVPLLLSLAGCKKYVDDGFATPLLFMKAATSCLAWYFVVQLRGDTLYFYYNLHASRRLLFITWLLADLGIFSFCLWLIRITQ